MPIYIAQALGPDGPVKIGFSNKVGARLRKISVHLWCDVELARLLDGDREAERALHRRFQHLRLRGEWFRAAPEILTGPRPFPDRPLSAAAECDPEPRWRDDHAGRALQRTPLYDPQEAA